MIGPLTRQEAAELAKVASRVAAKWQHVNREDVYQDMWVWALRNVKWIERYRDRQAEPHGAGKLNKALYRAGTDSCVKQEAFAKRVHRDELVEHDPAFSRPAVKVLLRYVWSTESWPWPSSDNHTESADVETAYTMLIDITNAVARLNKRDQQILRWAFADQLTSKALAKRLDVSVDGAWKAKERALTRLLAYL